MLSSNIRLFTWIDVEAVIQSKFEKKEQPDYLIWVRSYWDGLTVGIVPGKEDALIKWLSEIFDPRFDIDNKSIILESLADNRRFLKVIIEETEEILPKQKFRPILHRLPVLCDFEMTASPDDIEANFPPVVAFHSFKGGVGRTVSALSLVKAITDLNKDARILFVDADLEAPGVSWLVQSRFPIASVSFADFLAMVHGDPNPDGRDSIDIVADRIRDMIIGQTYILPAFRTISQYSSLEIRPEHLIQGSQNPFIMTEAVASLGYKLGVDLVVVDLRAGLSELSTGFLLDPRVFRVLVSTLSSQSIEGTCQVMELIGRLAPSSKYNQPVPAIIFSQVPEELVNNGLIVKYEERILESAKSFLESENLDDYTELPRIITPFTSILQVLDNDWNDVMKRVSQSGLADRLSQLIGWFPIIGDSKEKSDQAAECLNQKRQKLAEFSKKLIYAETSALNKFLSISPLKNLASDYLTKVPVSVVIGAKGSGKTYTFLQVIFRKNWAEFVRAAGVDGKPHSGFICPVLRSKNLDQNTKTIISDVRLNIAKSMNNDSQASFDNIQDIINDNLINSLHEGRWRDVWLDILAWSTGYKNSEAGAGRQLPQYLSEQKTRIIYMIDGLEDLFQNFSSDENQKTAIRSLIQDVPEWLEQQPERNVGLLVFIRQDMVLSSVKQNSAQLMARYEPYALRWNVEEALRLAAWICNESDVTLSDNGEELQRKNKENLTNLLIELWGRKLGRENSKEARSADWVIAALSDYNGQIQARDLVRFLNEAAKGSELDKYWHDRILVPTAIKTALTACSNEKIKEIGDENTNLKDIFNTLRNLKPEERLAPFTKDQVGLNTDQIQILENNGVVYLEKEEYYIPEIYRAGLGFKLKAGARPRVLALSRKIRK